MITLSSTLGYHPLLIKSLFLNFSKFSKVLFALNSWCYSFLLITLSSTLGYHFTLTLLSRLVFNLKTFPNFPNMEIPQEFIKRFFIKSQNLYWAAKSEYLNCLSFPSSKCMISKPPSEELVQIFPFPQNFKKGLNSRCWMFT